MTPKSPTSVSEGRVGRYVLEDLVAEGKAGTQLWRASDPALRRPVGARLIPIKDPCVPRMREAARAAASVHERAIVQVLDVVETPHFLAVITEWVSGRPWTEVVLGAEEPEGAEGIAGAVVIGYEVARALQAAHALGVPHGRLRPSSVMITEDGEVRLRGLQIDAAIYGVAPGDDPFAADVHGVGAVLFAGLTGRWPDPEHSQGAVDGMPIAGGVGGRLPAASELVAGVPPQLSRIAGACLAATDTRRTRLRIPDMDHAVAALAGALHDAPDHANRWEWPHTSARRASPGRLLRWLVAAGIAGITLAAVLLAVHELSGFPRGGQEARPLTSPVAPSAVLAEREPQPLAIAAAQDFDPQGSDIQENPELVPLALDGQEGTAWLTVPYRSSGMDPKEGTGLLLDLGLPRPIWEIRLALVGSGTDVEIRSSQTRGTNAEDYTLLAQAVGVGPQLTIRTPTPMVTQYVLIWLTNLPYGQDSYQGGIREVQILS